MSTVKPEILPDVHDPDDDDVLILPGPIQENEEHDEPHESRASEVLHRSRPENSPPVKAVNMPF